MSTLKEHEREQAATTAAYEVIAAKQIKKAADLPEIPDNADLDALTAIYAQFCKATGLRHVNAHQNLARPDIGNHLTAWLDAFISAWEAAHPVYETMPCTLPVPVHGGNDPEDMNAKRQVWGAALARRLMELTGSDPEDAVSDAICDLLHAAPTFGETAEQAVRRAIEHFNAETGEG